MNRRHFLRTLGIGVAAAPVIAVALAKPPRPKPPLHNGVWLQTTRTTRCTSPEYEAAVRAACSSELLALL